MHNPKNQTSISQSKGIEEVSPSCTTQNITWRIIMDNNNIQDQEFSVELTAEELADVQGEALKYTRHFSSDIINSVIFETILKPVVLPVKSIVLATLMTVSFSSVMAILTAQPSMAKTIEGTKFNDNNTVNGDNKFHKSLIGTPLSDKITGKAGNDILIGNAGNDELDGGIGNDKLFGGIGNDYLLSGTGKDYLTGGTGKDTFSINNKGFYATITDFNLGQDVIQVQGSTADYSFKLGNWEGNKNVPDTGIFFNGNLIGVVQDINLTKVNPNRVLVPFPQ
jgi:Ca2+-binding RTX toxin-like protein